MVPYQVEVRLLLLLPARISQLMDEPCKPFCMFATALLHSLLQGICSLCQCARSCLLGLLLLAMDPRFSLCTVISRCTCSRALEGGWSCIVQLLHQAALEDGDVTGTRNDGYRLLLLLGAAFSFCQ